MMLVALISASGFEVSRRSRWTLLASGMIFPRFLVNSSSAVPGRKQKLPDFAQRIQAILFKFPVACLNGATPVPNIIKIYDIFSCLITKYWLSHSSPAALGELRDIVGSSRAAAGELRNNQDIVIRNANMS